MTNHDKRSNSPDIRRETGPEPREGTRDLVHDKISYSDHESKKKILLYFMQRKDTR